MVEGRSSEISEETKDNDIPKPISLKQRTLRGIGWTLTSYFFNQGLRLVSNLILTRLLFPKAFGLMAIVYALITGLEMFSDTGVTASIIQNKRGDDPEFLNTGWTIQVIRGCLLWLCSCVLASPIALLYQEPLLAQLLPVIGLQCLIQGMFSTKLTTTNRQLFLGRLTLIDIAVQVIGIGSMILIAWLYQSIWALVVGTLVGGLVKLTLTHTFLKGNNNRLAWNKDALKEFRTFGQWIFVSTVLTFFALQSDRLIIPRLTDVSFLGVYTVALTLSRTAIDVINSLGGRVLFPSYAELARERPERLYKALKNVRLMLISFSWVAGLFFILFGKQVISLLYDERYIDAGWILQFLAIGLLIESVGYSYGNVLLAKGRTLEMAVLNALQAGTKLTGIFLGATLGGSIGLVLGIAASGWLLYPAQAICYRRLSLWQPEIDIPFIGVALAIAGLFFTLQPLPVLSSN